MGTSGNGGMAPDPELELELIREFSVNGVLLGGAQARDRREHIRVSIYRDNLVHKPFRDLGMSYAEAYERCFGSSIEHRREVHIKPRGDVPE